jgi:hypothetical protein
MQVSPAGRLARFVAKALAVILVSFSAWACTVALEMRQFNAAMQLALWTLIGAGLLCFIAWLDERAEK